MSKLDLRVRDLTTGVSSLMTFGDESAATTWLAARPRNIEVLGVATTLTSETNARLRGAMRPFDVEEKALQQKMDDAINAVAREREEEKQKREQASAEAHREAMRTGDPNRLMEVHFTYNKDLTLVDPADLRPITDEAREAVLAWVRERDEWVKDRGQVVGDAKVVVWPGPIPDTDKSGERVKRGTFVPVTAAAKKE